MYVASDKDILFYINYITLVCERRESTSPNINRMESNRKRDSNFRECLLCRQYNRETISTSCGIHIHRHYVCTRICNIMYVYILCIFYYKCLCIYSMLNIIVLFFIFFLCVVFVFLFFYIWLLTSKSEVEFVFNKNDLKNLMKILYVLVPKSDSFWERRSYPIDFATFIFRDDLFIHVTISVGR